LVLVLVIVSNRFEICRLPDASELKSGFRDLTRSPEARHYKPDQITHLYGAEPNENLHAKLQKNCAAAGLSEYTVLTCGAQPTSLLPELVRQGLLKDDRIPNDGLFDTIVTVKSLCSAPPEELKATIDLVHRLLKPGGEFIFFEHVHSHDDLLTSILVWFTDFFWPYLMGNCRLSGKLDEYLERDQSWAEKNISNIREYKGFEPIRYVKGYCRASSVRGWA
jgi:SAM-dependent methyltransferase